MGKQKTIVISAVNLVSGGTFSILKSCLDYVSSSDLADKYRIVALINKKDGRLDYHNIELLEFPKSKKRWLYRIYYEYFGFRKLSRRLEPHLWLSLHDMTPTVKAEIRAVYTHNVSPFLKWKPGYIFHSPVYVMFALFYKYLLRINIHKNDYLIVQQGWLRDAFSEMFNIDRKKIIVARPESELAFVDGSNILNYKDDGICRFSYPAYPRPFKNFEVICEAVSILEKSGITGFEALLTIDGSENGYSSGIIKKYGHLKNIRFTGIVPPKEVDRLYQESDCLIFPSVLETWGLPISEFAAYNKPIIASDLPYAHETAAGTKLTSFFSPDDPAELAQRIKEVIKKDYSGFKEIPPVEYAKPFAGTWKEMFGILLSPQE